MKFLIDAQLPPSLARWLSANGNEALHVEEADLRDGLDDAVRKFAIENGYVLVTKDRDFVPAEGSPSLGLQVLWVRTGNISNRELLKRLTGSWPRILTHLESGAPIVELR